MRQMFFDARTGKEIAKPDDSGKGDNRILAMLKKLVGAEAAEKSAVKPKPTPRPGPTKQVKKVYETSIDPDTGEPKQIPKYDAKKKPSMPPRPMPGKPKPSAPAAAPAFSPRGAAAPQIKPPVFDPSVIPGPDGGPTGAGGKMGASAPEPPSQQGGGGGKPGGGHGYRPPQPPNPTPVPPVMPPAPPAPVMPPTPGPPLPQSMGGQIFDGKVRYDGQPKVKKVMDEWKSGKLHSGSKTGPVVKNQKQAIAIALSEARKGKK